MKLGVAFGGMGMDAASIVERAQHAERIGFHSLWTGEAWGTDAVVPLTWAAAHTSTIKLGTSILQMPARTPTMTAMTAMTLDELSGGRLLLGLGMSGPQVVEGWHGVPYGKPLARTREYVDIVRKALAGEKVVPYGDAKALRSSAAPRPDIPIYVAAIGPKNIRQTAEITDGLLPAFMSATQWGSVFGADIAGAKEGFEVAPLVQLVTGDDIGRCRDRVRPLLGLYIGGMGPRGRNFYNDLVCRYGYEAEARHIQDLYLDGHRREAVASVPDALVDEVALVGDAAHIADQLDAWRASPATTLILNPARRTDLDLIAGLA